MSNCIKQCQHVIIDDALLEQAKKDDYMIKKQKGLNNYTTVLMTQNNDIIGSLAQNSVFKLFDENNIYVKKSPFFDPTIHKDTCDFEYRGLNDVKGKPARYGYSSIYPHSDFLLREAQLAKVVDWYTFVMVDIERLVAHIAGVIKYADFISKSKAFENPNRKSDARSILVRHLKPFNDYMYGV